jgi:hypothetical protein
LLEKCGAGASADDMSHLLGQIVHRSSTGYLLFWRTNC